MSKQISNPATSHHLPVLIVMEAHFFFCLFWMTAVASQLSPCLLLLLHNLLSTHQPECSFKMYISISSLYLNAHIVSHCMKNKIQTLSMTNLQMSQSLPVPPLLSQTTLLSMFQAHWPLFLLHGKFVANLDVSGSFPSFCLQLKKKKTLSQNQPSIPFKSGPLQPPTG